MGSPGLGQTQSWVRHWDEQMMIQTARRPTMPPHYSTGALDPQIAVVRQMLERRAWTFRNLPRMNALLGLARLRINRMDITERWASAVAAAVSAEQAALAGASDRRKTRPAGARLDEQARFLLDGSREYSLRASTPCWRAPPTDEQPTPQFRRGGQRGRSNGHCSQLIWTGGRLC